MNSEDDIFKVLKYGYCKICESRPMGENRHCKYNNYECTCCKDCRITCPHEHGIWDEYNG